jgi:triphosphoribosyl-dephospho-CoA synthase
MCLRIVIDLNKNEVADRVGCCAQLAALLEVSAYPKPGNVHRLRDFPVTKYEHFLAGSVSLFPSMRSLARSGYEVRNGSKNWFELGIGNRILETVKESFRWQTGGNVNLGIILLFAPISAAAGYLLGGGSLDLNELRNIIRVIAHSTTLRDSVNLYEAIRFGMTNRVLGQIAELDVNSDSSIRQIKKNKITLYEIFRKCSSRDTICREWVSGYEITFTKGYSFLSKSLKKTNDINSVVVDTFLHILSEEPDSLIQRKNDLQTALGVSDKAKAVMSEGGYSSQKGYELIVTLDKELQEAGGRLNPGTTADITAASIYLLLLDGWRP